MNKPLDLVSTVISPLFLLLLLAAGSAAAAEGEPTWAPVAAAAAEELGVAEEPEPQLFLDDGLDSAGEDRQVDVLEQKGGALGYNFVFSDGFGGRALEYGWLKSSRSGGLFYRHMERDSNLEVDGFYLNEHDYHGDLLLDYRGDYRLHLRTESLYHNLDRELLFTPDFQAGRADAPTLADYLARQDPPARYGVSVVQDLVDFRYRLHDYPLHLNLGYWRYLKEGTIQQRFADASFEGTPNTLYAVPRAVDHQTQEGRLGLDAHLGGIDLIYDFRIRVFEDRLPTPEATFVARNGLDGNPETAGGLRQHNDNPRSRYLSHTIKLHTSMNGGLVGSGSYSIDQRENLSRLTDTVGVKHAKVNLQNMAADLVYTPAKEYSLALKYRRQELDNANRGEVASFNFVNPGAPLLPADILVKPPVDTTKDVAIATLSYKPRLNLSFTGEYRGEFLERTNVSALPSPASWALPENSATHTGSLALFYRPVKGLRTSANYSYATTDHPSYGASFRQRHEGKVLATYTRNNSWGATAHAVMRREKNDEVQLFLINFPLEPLIYTPYPLLSRKRDTENSNLGVWFVPLPRLTVGGNYAYLQSRVDQPVLFTAVFAGSEAATEFSSRSHVYGVNASYALDGKLDLSLMLQQVRSHSAFKPAPTTFPVITGGTSGIRELTEQDTVLSSLSARGEYRFNQVLSTSLEYTLRDYDEKNTAYSAYNGTVHAVIAGVAAKW